MSDKISVRTAGLVALLRTVDTGGFWSSELGITYLPGSDEPVAASPAVPDDGLLREALTEMVAAFDALRGQTIWIDDDGKGTVQRLRTAHDAARSALASSDRADPAPAALDVGVFDRLVVSGAVDHVHAGCLNAVRNALRAQASRLVAGR